MITNLSQSFSYFRHGHLQVSLLRNTRGPRPRDPDGFHNLQRLHPFPFLLDDHSLSLHHKYLFSDTWYQISKTQVVDIAECQETQANARHDVPVDASTLFAERGSSGGGDEERYQEESKGRTVDQSRSWTPPWFEAPARQPGLAFAVSEVEQPDGNEEPDNDQHNVRVNRDEDRVG